MMAERPDAGGPVRLREILVHDRRSPGDVVLAAPFDRYSMAAFASGCAETVQRAGRGARLVQPGDILLSRSLDAPRRAWMVAPDPGRPQIASGEWLVLRSKAYAGGYLRHLLVSNAFQLRFVAALDGAALATSRRAALGAIELPCPPLPRQGAVARLLDHLDGLRAKRRGALDALKRLQAAWPRTAGETNQDCAIGSPRPGAVPPLEELRGRMQASARQLDALLGVLRDRAFRDEIDADRIARR